MPKNQSKLTGKTVLKIAVKYNTTNTIHYYEGEISSNIFTSAVTMAYNSDYWADTKLEMNQNVFWYLYNAFEEIPNEKFTLKDAQKGVIFNGSQLMQMVEKKSIEDTFASLSKLKLNEIPTTPIDRLNLFLSTLGNITGYSIYELFDVNAKSYYETLFGGKLGAKTCTAKSFKFLDTSSSFSDFKIIARDVKYSDGTVPKELFYWVWADENGESSKVKHYAKKILNTNDWEVLIPRSEHNNAIGDYNMNCWAVNSPETKVKEALKTTIKKDAVVVVPGLMGSRLKIDGDKVWNPLQGLIGTGWNIITLGFALKCDDEGKSVNRVMPINDNKGALDIYKTLYDKLEEKFNKEYDVIFFAYDWRLDCDINAELLEEVIDKYDKVNLVAHSMGGLVSSAYMARSTENYNKVKTLTTIATPFTGSAKAPVIFETGEVMGNSYDLALKGAIKDIAPNMMSAYQLIPTNRYKLDSFVTNVTYAPMNGTVEHIQLNSYNESMDIIKATNWAYQKSFFFNAFSNFHDSLIINNRHITDDSKKVLYIAGTGHKTINSLQYVFEEFPATIFSYCFTNTSFDGDGTVMYHSANNTSETNNPVYSIYGTDHTKIVSDNRTNTKVIEQIETGGNNSSSTFFDHPVTIVENDKKLGVLIYTEDDLTIIDEKGNEIFSEGNFLYKIEDGERIKVGSIWYSGENREQYNLNPDLEYKFTF